MEDDYSLIDHNIVKPDKKYYKDWNSWWQKHCEYLVLKYKDTYGSKEKKKA